MDKILDKRTLQCLVALRIYAKGVIPLNQCHTLDAKGTPQYSLTSSSILDVLLSLAPLCS